MNASHQNRPLKPARVTGEAQVWLTAMGLSIGLIMVVGLLAIILINGIEVFWPKRIVELTMKDGDKTISIAGEIVIERDKPIKTDETVEREIQLFTGNKDVYGQGFRFIDEKDVVSRSQPAGVLKVERMEYGNAIGMPVSLKLKGGEVIPATDPRFNHRLQELIDEVTDRRNEILYLEQSVIGANARRMTDLGYQRKSAESSNDQAAIAEIDAEVATLQADFEILRTKALELRARQKDHQLVLKLFTGEERTLIMGDLVKVTWSNELSLIGRVGLTFSHLWSFMVEKPREANTEGGIWPAIFGTFVMTILMSIAVTPFGVVAAIYLREYAKQGPIVRIVRIAVNNLAGVPSIVFGVFGLGFFVYIMGGTIDSLFFSDKGATPTFGTGGILWASLTLALMTVPVVIVATEESVAAVPRGAKEGSLALGASKWQTIQRVVLPAAIPGILTGLILAMARGAGEVAPLMLVGVVKLAPSLPIDGIYPFFHLDQKFMHLGFHIYDLGFQSPDSEAAKPMVFATTFFLILLVMALNLGAIVLRDRIRRRFATSAF
ncbi:MAG: phosphate ABC transporter permease PstA [Planctomycetes bacterium]|nr:phosphate ABC transporter permease PstA [Planctomycetota bacterium]